MSTQRYRVAKAVVAVVLAGAFLVAPRSWAQMPPPDQIPLMPPEEPLVIPPPGETPLIGQLPPGAAPVPPADEPETNDQGVYDPADGFAVYTGAVYPGTAWSHHHAYRKLTRSWYRVLRSKPAVQNWFQQSTPGAFEIRYWGDPIPGPLSYVNRAIMVTADGNCLAEVYALSAREFRYRMDELREFFGRPIYLSPAKLHQGKRLPSQSTVIDGGAFAYGAVTVWPDTAVTAGVYTNTWAGGGGLFRFEGRVPRGFMGPMDLVNSYYDADALLAYTLTLPRRDVGVSSLRPQVLYVNGRFSLAPGGVIEGPTVIVATGKIDLGAGARIGDNVAFISAQQLTAMQRTTFGQEAFLYGIGRVEVQAGTQIASGLVLGLSEVLVKENVWFGDALICGYARVRVCKGSTIQGSVISLISLDLG